MSDNSDDTPQPRRRLGHTTPPRSLADLPPLSNPNQQALREELINVSRRKRFRRELERSLKSINGSRELSYIVRGLFNKEGRPSELTPLKDIIEYRQKLEMDYRWLQAILSELTMELAAIKTLEDAAMDVAQQADPDDAA